MTMPHCIDSDGYRLTPTDWHKIKAMLDDVGEWCTGYEFSRHPFGSIYI